MDNHRYFSFYDIFGKNMMEVGTCNGMGLNGFEQVSGGRNLGSQLDNELRSLSALFPHPIIQQKCCITVFKWVTTTSCEQ